MGNAMRETRHGGEANCDLEDWRQAAGGLTAVYDSIWGCSEKFRSFCHSARAEASDLWSAHYRGQFGSQPA